MQNAAIFYGAIALLGGAAVPFLAAINAAYGTAIGNVPYAALTLCAVAFLTVLGTIVASGTAMPTMDALKGASWWHFAGGCFFAVYVVSITFVAPKIGLANAIILVVVAQIFTAVLIDHFGLMGAAVQKLDWTRALGVVFLIAGVWLARSQTTTSPG